MRLYFFPQKLATAVIRMKTFSNKNSETIEPNVKHL